MDFSYLGATNNNEDTLVKFENTYATVEEADYYIRNFIPKKSMQYIEWFKLEDNDKAVLLKASTESLDKLLYQGSKLNNNQPLEFPRNRFPAGFSGTFGILFTPQSYDAGLITQNNSSSDPLKNGTKDITAACIENAMYQNIFGDAVTDNVITSLKRITSHSIGNTHISYDKNSIEGRMAQKGIYNSTRIFHLLRDWTYSDVYTL